MPILSYRDSVPSFMSFKECENKWRGNSKQLKLALYRNNLYDPNERFFWKRGIKIYWDNQVRLFGKHESKRRRDEKIRTENDRIRFQNLIFENEITQDRIKNRDEYEES